MPLTTGHPPLKLEATYTMGKRKRDAEVTHTGNLQGKSSPKHERRSAQAVNADKTSHLLVQYQERKTKLPYFTGPGDPLKPQCKRKRRRRQSNHAANEADPNSAVAIPVNSPRSGPPERRISVPVDNFEDPLMPTGLSKHARRRWRHKMIKDGMIAKGKSPEASAMKRPNTNSDVPMAQRGKDDWLDKPVGRKALARHLATTTLMRPPMRRWENQSSADSVDADVVVDPWKRSAATCSTVVVPNASATGDTDAKSVVSGVRRPFGMPRIHPEGPKANDGSAQDEDSTLGPSLRSSLSRHFGSPSASKRQSFASKANSVPTYLVGGNTEERFRRFNAAAHRRAFPTDDETTSSESSTDEGHMRERGHEKASAAIAQPARTGEARKDWAPGESSEHKINTEYDGFRTLAELNASADQPRSRKSSVSQLPAGPLRRTSQRGEQNVTASKTAADLYTRRGSQSTFDTSPLDDDMFDAYQTVHDVFQHEMTMTRELPAGKKTPTLNNEPADGEGNLTEDFSDRRLTRSASKAKQQMLAKCTDSALPDAESSVVTVQSVQLPETRDGDIAQHAAETDQNTHSTERNAAGTPDAKSTQGVWSHRRSSSPLSELMRSPSPVQHDHSNTALHPYNRSMQEDVSEEGSNIDVAAPDRLPEAKKKRKMTGLTSKHFSTPKANKKQSKRTKGDTRELATPIEAVLPTPGDDHSTQTATEQMDPSPTKQVLAIAKDMLRDKPGSAAQNVAGQRKKRSRPSGGNITDLSDANVIEGRPRRSNAAPINRALDADGPSDDQIQQRASNSLTTEASKADEMESRPMKRRRTGGRITDVDASNILEGRATRRSTDVHLDQDAGADQGVDRFSKTQNVNAEAVPKLDDDERPSRGKKRARRNGGSITDVDASNITGSQLRTRKKKDRGTGAEDEYNDRTDEPDGPDEPESLEDQAAIKPKAKRKSTGKRSIYFLPPKPPLPDTVDRVDHYNTTGKKKRVPAGVSVAPVPPIHSDRFGIIQEKLWREPFWLLIAVTFLNKTAGRAAAPTFWKLKEQYQTPEALAKADQGELCDMITHLGLQTQRSKRLIAMAKAWVESEPQVGVRWRVLHYPAKGDGKEYKAREPIEQDADDVSGAIEIGRIPGCGPYAMDSWRIFCRDVLRGVAEDYNESNAEAEGFVPEWQKVLPGDKELRACLRWMWLREGWIWDHETGTKRRATAEEMERAVKGEMEVADQQERVFAARAAGVERQEVEAEVGADEGKAADDNAPFGGDGVPKASRKRKRTATPEVEDGASSDNIVVGSPVKKRRTSGRRAAARTAEA